MTPQNRSQRISLTLSASALVIAIGGTGGPALAAAVFANNSDKVDGKHAVGAGASVDKRKGKLIATNKRTGRLPNNIIAKAPNSKTLDGKEATEFLGATDTAADSELLDGLDSTSFATLALLGAAGTFNSASNPVDWTQLKNVPNGLNDGDAGQGTTSAIQVPTQTLAGNGSVTWTTHGWPKDWWVQWQAFPKTQDGRVQATVVVEDAGPTYTYWITVKNLTASPVVYDVRYLRQPLP
jgi:hypothetical protein